MSIFVCLFVLADSRHCKKSFATPTWDLYNLSFRKLCRYHSISLGRITTKQLVIKRHFLVALNLSFNTKKLFRLFSEVTLLLQHLQIPLYYCLASKSTQGRKRVKYVAHLYSVIAIIELPVYLLKAPYNGLSHHRAKFLKIPVHFLTITG